MRWPQGSSPAFNVGEGFGEGPLAVTSIDVSARDGSGKPWPREPGRWARAARRAQSRAECVVGSAGAPLSRLKGAGLHAEPNPAPTRRAASRRLLHTDTPQESNYQPRRPPTHPKGCQSPASYM